jgi:hypothetical protein
VDRLSRSELFDLIEKIGGTGGGPMPTMPWKTTEWQPIADTIADVVFVMLPDEDDALAILRTKNDISLGELAGLIEGLGTGGGDSASSDSPTPEPQTHAGAEYVSFRGGFLAKTGQRTFCGTDKEPDLKAALGRLQRNEKAQLSDKLQEALDSARGDNFFAMVVPAGSSSGLSSPFPMARMEISAPEWVGMGFTVDSSITIDGAVGFPAAKDAEKIKQEYDKAMQSSSEPPPGAPEQMREFVSKLQRMVKALKLSQSGSTLEIRGSWNIRDIEELIDQAKQSFSRPSMMPRPPSFSGP